MKIFLPINAYDEGKVSATILSGYYKYGGGDNNKRIQRSNGNNRDR